METKNNSQFSIFNSQLICVAIVDDHKIVVDGLEQTIAKSGIAQLVGKAYSAAECMQMLKNEQPQVLLLDIGLPDESGMDLCPKIKFQYPAVNILMLTSYSEYAIIKQVLNNGASGYILKSSDADEIIEGILTVASGKRFLSEEVDVLLHKKRDQVVELTRREHELLKLIAAGYTSIEIADKMCLGYETIRSYRKNLHVKLGAHNTADLTKIALSIYALQTSR
jgi:DNA-binding NarL/FixJ family response regulator